MVEVWSPVVHGGRGPPEGRRDDLSVSVLLIESKRSI